jgi:cytochrome bd ubiquinol oxidase subunit I
VDFTYLSRLQFAFTSMFHILWPVHIVGMSIFLFILEAMWLRTGDEDYYHHARFWAKLFLLNTAVGVVTGIPLEFQFGTNWAVFSHGGSGFFGNMLGFEAALAFMLEASFLGIMLYGWQRVTRGTHLFATGMVAFGATLSAFWIMVANSWLQTPAGGTFRNGEFFIEDHFKAIFNPNMPWGVSHMWIACIQVSCFVVGGVSAWYVLRGRQERFFLKSFKLAAVAAIIITPLQIFLGDGSGRSTYYYQPTKLAGMESHWNTNKPGEGAPWHIAAWPDPAKEKNAWSLDVPYGLSLITTRSLTGTVRGLRDFPPGERPPILLPFYGFRVMVLVGGLSVLLALWTLWVWFRKGFETGNPGKNKFLLLAWMGALPLNYIAMEAGWVVREVGRQPYLVYGGIKTMESASRLPGAAAGASLAVFFAAYLLLFVTFVVLAALIIRKGPALTGVGEGS